KDTLVAAKFPGLVKILEGVVILHFISHGEEYGKLLNLNWFYQAICELGFEIGAIDHIEENGGGSGLNKPEKNKKDGVYESGIMKKGKGQMGDQADSLSLIRKKPHEDSGLGSHNKKYTTNESWALSSDEKAI
ncbi:hypothetical protein ACJX0J_019759, partial [Zea mays]